MKHVKIYENVNFATRMRFLMGARNINLKDIAAATSCAVSTVSTWRRGRIPRNYKTLKKLAKALDVSEDFLLNGDTSIEIFSNEKTPDATNQKKSAASVCDLQTIREVTEILVTLTTQAAKTAGGYDVLRRRLLEAFPEAAQKK